MLVTADSIHGTIGGGHLEYIAIDAARRQLARPAGTELHRFPLGASLGQCCGGVVNLLIEPITADARWLDSLAAFAERDEPFVIVTPVRQTPAGGQLLASGDRSEGTLGSPHLDEPAMRDGRGLLTASQRAQLATLANVPDDHNGVQCLFDPVTRPH